MKKYLVVIEETDTGYSAYSPDLEGLQREGLEIPQPHTYSAYVEVPA